LIEHRHSMCLGLSLQPTAHPTWLHVSAVSGTALQTPLRTQAFYQNFYQACGSKSRPATLESLYGKPVALRSTGAAAVWSKGVKSAFQAGHAGSIPATRSRYPQISLVFRTGVPLRAPFCSLLESVTVWCQLTSCFSKIWLVLSPHFGRGLVSQIFSHETETSVAYPVRVAARRRHVRLRSTAAEHAKTQDLRGDPRCSCSAGS
jgi:hypothetical protein